MKTIFKPKRPDVLTIKHCSRESAKGQAMLDAAYDHYCDVYYDNLGKPFTTQGVAQDLALHAALYMATLCALSEFNKMERYGE